MKSDKSADVQYAALPWRRRGETLEVMLLTSRETRRWVIPKGWPMIDCEPGQCAAQEAFEEGGVRGRVGEKLGTYTYDKVLKNGASRRLTVEVFPLEVVEELGEWPEVAERERRWVDAGEAAGLVAEPDLAEILRRFSASSAPPHI